LDDDANDGLGVVGVLAEVLQEVKKTLLLAHQHGWYGELEFAKLVVHIKWAARRSCIIIMLMVRRSCILIKWFRS
jgi:hypothetical protein